MNDAQSIAIALLAGGLLACGEAGALDPTAAGRPVEQAVAVLEPTAGHEAHGVVRFRADGERLRVVADVDGLEPGVHAFHVHVWGDCSRPDATSAGTHFNFEGPSLALPPGIDRITGNLGELHADADGHAHVVASVARADLDGPRSIVGRAVIVHERGNDLDSPPIGAAGPRVACAVIGIGDDRSPESS
jgi:Cu-Zn family superoxide dismutase